MKYEKLSIGIDMGWIWLVKKSMEIDLPPNWARRGGGGGSEHRISSQMQRILRINKQKCSDFINLLYICRVSS